MATDSPDRGRNGRLYVPQFFESTALRVAGLALAVLAFGTLAVKTDWSEVARDLRSRR